MKTLPQELIRELWSYHDGHLIWKIKPQSDVEIGDIAGHKAKIGVQIGYAGNTYLAHRLIWIYHNGEPCPILLDHIDRNCFNNRIENLRPATKSQNNLNSLIIKGLVPYRGVYFHKLGNRFTSQIQVKGVQYHLGMFDTAEEANQAYENARESFYPGLVRKVGNGKLCD